MLTVNLDTHILIAVLAGTLSRPEEEYVSDKDLAISDIVLWEIAKLVQRDRLAFDLASLEFGVCLDHLRIFPITRSIAQKSTQLDFSSDPADEIIAATSIVEQVPLMTRDSKILASRIVPFAVTRA